MKLAIVGSRTFNTYKHYALLSNTIHYHFRYYSYIANNLRLVSGGARGADTLAERFAKERDLGIIVYKPDWDKHGRIAGFIRNQQIVDTCDMVLAFWDGKSKGTQDTINKAKKAKKPTFIVYF